jgi:hypothetical protein
MRRRRDTIDAAMWDYIDFLLGRIDGVGRARRVERPDLPAIRVADALYKELNGTVGLVGDIATSIDPTLLTRPEVKGAVAAQTTRINTSGGLRLTRLLDPLNPVTICLERRAAGEGARGARRQGLPILG